ncbi:lasso peptide biosynthesis PqqD family chaperone [Streptomyces sp. S.PB5]|uniref:lasso peptide biosynthesis PqqD family chaperone n=1 Tax=Streptomyces sp. S.PB5 TaxID=3020844 RepID=UPI0025AF1353|nr:lasso peptide biosynthesis PqqD family chaperone [Streptomyces sp. S.PB5]MDN3025986.1 lasso peptide biosynthesis PqqD family chaperone [Streptomyces sp. S.PB5]
MHRLRADVSACAVDDGMVLLDERVGRYWQLNGTGALVVRSLLDGATPAQIVERLAATRPVTRERVAADVTALVSHLVRERLVSES